MSRSLLLTLLLRAIATSAMCIFIWRAYEAWQLAPSLTLALLVLGECVTIAIYLTARITNDVSFRLIAVLSTICATFFFLFITLDYGAKLVPLWVSAPLQLGGIVWQIVSKATLRRSFGLLPANRGIVSTGTYRFVRHPIYFGYLSSHLGFLLGNFGLYNVALIVAVAFCQIIRIREEEALLLNDPEYQNYAQRVRWRLLPKVW
jgi:protein-S-isoprenylcysteine O-methyltransferase Ste14